MGSDRRRSSPSRYRVVALDFRGHGDSDFPEELEVGAFHRDLEALREQLPGREVALVGHSLGGHVALDHAARHSDVWAVVAIEISSRWRRHARCRFRRCLCAARSRPVRRRCLRLHLAAQHRALQSLLSTLRLRRDPKRPRCMLLVRHVPDTAVRRRQHCRLPDRPCGVRRHALRCADRVRSMFQVRVAVVGFESPCGIHWHRALASQLHLQASPTPVATLRQRPRSSPLQATCRPRHWAAPRSHRVATPCVAAAVRARSPSGSR